MVARGFSPTSHHAEQVPEAGRGAILATLNQEGQGQVPESVNDGATRRQGAFVDG